MKELLFLCRCYSSTLGIFFIDFNLTLGSYLFSVPQFPHLWNKDVKVDHLFGLISKILWIWLPSPPSIYWAIVCLFLDLLCFVVCMEILHAWVFLLCFVFGTVLKKCFHLFSVKPEMLPSFSQVPSIRSISYPSKKMVLFSKTKLITGYISSFHFQTFRALSFGLFKVLCSTKFMAVISSPCAFRFHPLPQIRDFLRFRPQINAFYCKIFFF